MDATGATPIRACRVSVNVMNCLIWSMTYQEAGDLLCLMRSRRVSACLIQWVILRVTNYSMYTPIHSTINLCYARFGSRYRVISHILDDVMTSWHGNAFVNTSHWPMDSLIKGQQYGTLNQLFLLTRTTFWTNGWLDGDLGDITKLMWRHSNGDPRLYLQVPPYSLYLHCPFSDNLPTRTNPV